MPESHACSPASSVKHIKTLSYRELQIAIAISDGLTYGEISVKLKAGYETTRQWVKQLRDKTGLRRKAQLAVWASQQRGELVAQLAQMPKPAKKKRKVAA